MSGGRQKLIHNNILFCKLCHDNKKDFEHLLLCTAVQCLLKGAGMTHFYSYNSVIKVLFAGHAKKWNGMEWNGRQISVWNMELLKYEMEWKILLME